MKTINTQMEEAELRSIAVGEKKRKQEEQRKGSSGGLVLLGGCQEKRPLASMYSNRLLPVATEPNQEEDY